MSQNRITPNMGTIDRVIRLLIGLILMAVVFLDTGLAMGTVLASLLLLFALVNLAAAAVSFCPLYHMVNINTHSCARRED